MRMRSEHMVFALLLLVFAWGCEDWNLPRLDFVSLQMETLKEEENFVRVQSRITGLQRETVREYGHVWALDTGVLPTLDNHEGRIAFQNLRPGEALDPFEARISKQDFIAKNRYVFRAYALIGDRCFYSDNLLYYQSSPVVLQTLGIDYQTGNKAYVTGRINLGDPSVRVLDYGHCWSAAGAPQPEEAPCSNLGQLIAAEAEFTTEIEGLENGKTYTIRPYALIEISESQTDICYGAPVTFEAVLRQFWSPLEVPDALAAREGAHVFTYGDSVAFLSGGLFQDGSDSLLLDDCWRYSAATGWRLCAEELPIPLAFGTVFTIGDKAYAGGGWTTGQDARRVAITDRFFEFDMAQERWREVQALPQPLVFATGFSDGEAGYVGSGLTRTRSPATGNDTLLTTGAFWRYNPAGSVVWEKVDAETAPRIGMVSVKGGGQTYVGTGLDEFGVVSGAFWRFDGESFETVELGQDADARGFAVAFADNAGEAYLCLGVARSFELPREILQLSSAAEGWRPLLEFPAQGRLFAAGFSLQGKLFIGLGAPPEGRPLRDFWVYTP